MASLLYFSVEGIACAIPNTDTLFVVQMIALTQPALPESGVAGKADIEGTILPVYSLRQLLGFVDRPPPLGYPDHHPGRPGDSRRSGLMRHLLLWTSPRIRIQNPVAIFRACISLPMVLSLLMTCLCFFARQIQTQYMLRCPLRVRQLLRMWRIRPGTGNP